MNPITRLYRRSRSFRILLYLASFPLWAIIALVSADTLGKYSRVGDITLILSIMAFAAWAWWYGEDRDRRRASAAARPLGADQGARPAEDRAPAANGR